MSDFTPYTPDIENPYPESYGEISRFRFESHLYLGRAKDQLTTSSRREAEYIVTREYRCSFLVDGKPWRVHVPSGMLTDLTSSPWAARLIVNRVGPHLEAAIVHDYLFIAWQLLDDKRPNRTHFRFANDVMYAAMQAADVGFIMRQMIYAAVSSPIGWWTFRETERSEEMFVTVPPALPLAA